MIALFVLAIAASNSEQSLRKYEVTNDNKNQPIQVRVAPNRVTSVRFNRSYEAKTLFCGDSQRFGITPVDESQINVKATTDELGRDTNCTMLTKSGMPIVLNLLITEAKRADSFLDIVFSFNDLPLTEIELNRRLQQVEAEADERVVAARRECEDKSELGFVQRAAASIVARHMDARGISGDVILIVRDFIKLGSHGLIRVEIDNQSREVFTAGEVKLSFDAPGQQAVPIDVVTFYQQPVIDRNERTYGAIGFDMYQVGENAKFTLQVMERSGSRHPKITGLRL